MSERLNSTFAALADPTRRAILSRLALGEASVGDLAAPFDLSVRAISKHVSVLEKAGLISRTRSAQRRMSQLELAGLREAEDWLGEFRKLWDERFDRLESIINQIKRGSTDDSQT